MATEITLIGNAELHAAGIEKGVECAVHNALRANIHPAAGRHLPIVGNAHLHSLVPVGGVVKQADHHGVGDDDTRSVGTGGEKTQRMPRLHNESLLLGELFEIFLYKAVLKPVLTHLACLAICHQLIRIKGDVEA